MTGPAEEAVPGSDRDALADDAAAGKREPEAGARAGAGARPAEQPASPLAEAGVEPPTATARYTERLRSIWEATHEGDSPPAAEGTDITAWDLVQKAVDRVGNLTLIGAAVAALRRPATSADEDAGLSGDPGTVMFLVGAALEQLSPEDYPAWMAGPLTRTIDRLQREVGLTEDVSRERIVDIVIAALTPVKGTPLAGQLVSALLGYLNGDPRPRAIGIFQTVALLAQLMSGLDDRSSRLMRSFLYHYELLGLWHLLVEERRDFDGTEREVTALAAGNAGINLWQLLPDRTAAAPGAAMVRALRTIQTTASRELAVPEATAPAVLAALGLEHPNARAVLTVLDSAGGLGGAWTSDHLDMARIESAAAVTAAMTAAVTGAGTSLVAVRMYNASVSLAIMSAAQLPASRRSAPFRARMLLNALGLHWSLRYGSNPADALDQFEGLNCAIGFLRALSQYQDSDNEQTEAADELIAVAALLADLPLQLRRERPALVAGIARLADAADGIRLRRPRTRPEADPQDLRGAVTAAIDGLRPPGTARPTGAADAELLDTAVLVRGVFEHILGQAEWGFWNSIAELVALRDHPRDVFIEQYQPFTADGDFGNGPPVAAGVATRSEWEDIAARLLRDPRSLVPALRHAFPQQL